jgi:hypothetical protein
MTGLPAGSFYFTVVAVGPAGSGPPSDPSALVEINNAPVEVFVTTPTPMTGPGEATIRVTTNAAGAQVRLYDEPFAATRFFPKTSAVAAPSGYGNGVAELRVDIARSNRFYATVNGTRSNVVTAVVG